MQILSPRVLLSRLHKSRSILPPLPLSNKFQSIDLENTRTSLYFDPATFVNNNYARAYSERFDIYFVECSLRVKSFL